MDTHAGRLALISAFALLASCDQNPAPGANDDDDVVLGGTDSSKDFGDYIVYFNALNTDQLMPDVARQYDIVRSKNRAMLTVSVHRKQPGQLPKPVRAEVAASAVNLTGQLKTMSLREILEGDAVYYIGDLPINHSETLVYKIDVVPADETELLSLRYQQQFFARD